MAFFLFGHCTENLGGGKVGEVVDVIMVLRGGMVLVMREWWLVLKEKGMEWEKAGGE